MAAAGPAHGEQDLNKLLSTLTTHLDPETYVWISYEQGTAHEQYATSTLPITLRLTEPHFQLSKGQSIARPVDTVTFVTTREGAERCKLEYEYPCRRLTLAVESSLEAVGFMAVVGRALADEGISVNTVAGYWHDHLFIEEGKAEEAVRVIEGVREKALSTGSSAS